jgi:hypothetical protein
MRWVRPAVLVLAAAASLAGCRVDVEGAACSTPGTTDLCPSGQACGTGLTCSVRAASCAPCAAGVVECREGDVKRCTAEEPTCGSWVVETACEPGVTHCADRSGVGLVCGCDRFVVDPASPAVACHFDSITGAIAEAQAIAAETVWLGGAAPQTYGLSVGDAAPIIVPAGMTVSGEDAPLDPGSRIMEVHDGSGEGVRIEAGGSLVGVAVRRGSSAPPVAIRVVGASDSTRASLASVRVNAAGGAFATGIQVEGAGTVILQGIEVDGASGDGLLVARDNMVDAVTVTGALLSGNHVGAHLVKGDLTLEAPVVKVNVAEGVNADGGAAGTTRLTIQGGLIARNGGGGLVLAFNDVLHLVNTRVCRNAGVVRGIITVSRTVGGLFALGNSPGDLLVKGNWFHDNGGDQVLVGASGITSWNLAGTNCLLVGERNVFAGYATPGVGVTAVSASVAATTNAWRGSGLPTASVDYLTVLGGSVDARGAGADYCLPPTDPNELVCPP